MSSTVTSEGGVSNMLPMSGGTGYISSLGENEQYHRGVKVLLLGKGICTARQRRRLPWVAFFIGVVLPPGRRTDAPL